MQLILALLQLLDNLLSNFNDSSLTVYILNSFFPPNFKFVHDKCSDKGSTSAISIFAMYKYTHFIVERIIDKLDGWDEVSLNL